MILCLLSFDVNFTVAKLLSLRQLHTYTGILFEHLFQVLFV